MGDVQHVGFDVAPLVVAFGKLQGKNGTADNADRLAALERRISSIIASNRDPFSGAEMTRDEALAHLIKYDPHIGGDPIVLKRKAGVLGPGSYS